MWLLVSVCGVSVCLVLVVSSFVGRVSDSDSVVCLFGVFIDGIYWLVEKIVYIFLCVGVNFSLKVGVL